MKIRYVGTIEIDAGKYPNMQPVEIRQAVGEYFVPTSGYILEIVGYAERELAEINDVRRFRNANAKE